jgi:hypothetical protein
MPRRAASVEEQAGYERTTEQCRNVEDHVPYVIVYYSLAVVYAGSPTEPAYGNAPLQPPSNSPWSMNVQQNTFLYQPETLGNEFSVLRCVPA